MDCELTRKRPTRRVLNALVHHVPGDGTSPFGLLRRALFLTHDVTGFQTSPRIQGRVHMQEREIDTSLERWWFSLSRQEREAALRRPRGDPMPEWMVITLQSAGVPGIVETPVDEQRIVPPWFDVPETVNAFLSGKRRQRMPRSA